MSRPGVAYSYMLAPNLVWESSVDESWKLAPQERVARNTHGGHGEQERDTEHTVVPSWEGLRSKGVVARFGGPLLLCTGPEQGVWGEVKSG